MATRNLVPRISGEGGIGKINKAWATGVFDNLYFGGILLEGFDQNVKTTDNVEFASGNFSNGLTINGVNVSGMASSINTVESVLSGSAEFLFFSDVSDNQGVTNKVFYETPDPNLFLSGVTVASASDLRVELKWDGPNDDYVGEAFIEGQKIPLSNINQLGTDTRRFAGYIDNLNLEGNTTISGEANGRSVIIPLTELGSGPEALDIRIDPIESAIPKAGQLLGSTHLKQGDTINIEADFSTDDVSLIKVFNSGISQGVDFSSYTLSENNGTFTATIPVEISNRNSAQFVAIQAINSFGSTGDAVHSTGFINLDQTYPSINAANPTNYNGRSDGLRRGENTTFSNSISNWSDSSDTVSYTSLSSEISVVNSGIFESTKTVNYVEGIFNNSDNIEIYALRTNNGTTDTERVTAKIANGPQIISGSLDPLATSSTSPHAIGSQEVKAGDTLNSEIVIDGNGVSINNISISVQNEGVSKGTQTSFSSSYTKTTLSDGTYKFTVPISVFGTIGSSNRDGDQPASFKARNNFGTQSDKFTTADTSKLNNGSTPSVSISSISYPASQQAIKDTESATVSNTLNNYDSVIYSSPNNQLTISSPNTFEQNKNVDYLNGGYNVKNDGGQNNIKISATKTSNGITIEDQEVVNIADSPLILSINNLASSLSSSIAGESDQFNLSSSQLMLNTPTLSLDPSQSPPSSLTQINSGTSKNSNSYRINISDSDQKGTFNWQVSARNLANISTTNISTNSSYTLAGFSQRTIQASPNSIGAGLANIGTSVSNPSDVNFENISEGGSAPNGGTTYSYEPISSGTQLNNSFDLNNKFAICDSSGVADENGDHVFNLDKLNRSANTSTLNPASFVISEN